MAFPFEPAITAPRATRVQALGRLAVRLWDQALQPICLNCRTGPESNHGLCEKCLQLISLNATCCEICARPLTQNLVCGQCQKIPPFFDRALTPLLYVDPVDRFLCGLKYREQFSFARFAAGVMTNHALKTGQKAPDMICPVPMTSKTLRKRGFNQSAFIGQLIAWQLGIPMSSNLILKTRDTAHQSDLKAKERQNNLRGAFECKRQVGGRHIVIIDDVFTTGATANEISKTLKKNSASRVDIWACARTC